MEHYSTKDLLKQINQRTQPLYNAIVSISIFLKFFNKSIII